MSDLETQQSANEEPTSGSESDEVNMIDIMTGLDGATMIELTVTPKKPKYLTDGRCRYCADFERMKKRHEKHVTTCQPRPVKPKAPRKPRAPRKKKELNLPPLPSTPPHSPLPIEIKIE